MRGTSGKWSDNQATFDTGGLVPKTSRIRTGSPVIRRSAATIVTMQFRVGRILPVHKRKRSCLL